MGNAEFVDAQKTDALECRGSYFARVKSWADLFYDTLINFRRFRTLLHAIQLNNTFRTHICVHTFEHNTRNRLHTHNTVATGKELK